MIKDKENRAEIVRKLAAQGMNSSQIARETGFSSGSVYYYMHPEKRRRPEIPLDYKNPDATAGWNADRKKCRSCRYRARPEQNRSTDVTTLSMLSTVGDVRLRTAIGMCVERD